MLHLIPPALHRAGLRLAHAMRKRWWRLAKPRLDGVTMIARNSDGHVLLVRHTYGSGLWTLPGGGRRRGEPHKVAAAREFAEELGCALEALEAAGVHHSSFHGAHLTRHLFTGNIDRTPIPDQREVAEAQFFAPDHLPGNRSPMVDRYLELSQQR
jgi:ADP-ribose pyrophosphatase YjhB (NUDIX family)